MRLIARTLDQIRSPIDSAQALMRQYRGNRALLDLTQGAPNYATAPAIANRIAEVARSPDGGKYTARPGIEKLRELFSKEISETYAGAVGPDQVLITAGCNQAFCLAVSALADYGDEIIIPVPYYFNHDMWLRLDRLHPRYLTCTSDFVPDPRAAGALVNDKTKAIVLVTPGNPTGVTIPPSVIDTFADLAKEANIMLIIDETYKAFRGSDQPAHDLFRRQDWPDSIVSLHSFSKEFAIPGYRVGAAIGHSDLLVEMGKLFDCIAICAPRIGQEAVIEGLANCGDWRRDRALEIREKQTRFETMFASRPGGFELLSAGAFFGWVRHPKMNESSAQVVSRLLLDHGILVLPGTIFFPSDDRYLRFSFGNLSDANIGELGVRLSEFV